MSDRTNRDRGNKRNHQKQYKCSCWHCISGKEKKRLLGDKDRTNDHRRIPRESDAKTPASVP